jgi:hypothetical protein
MGIGHTSFLLQDYQAAMPDKPWFDKLTMTDCIPIQDCTNSGRKAKRTGQNLKSMKTLFLYGKAVVRLGSGFCLCD